MQIVCSTAYRIRSHGWDIAVVECCDDDEEEYLNITDSEIANKEFAPKTVDASNTQSREMAEGAAV